MLKRFKLYKCWPMLTSFLCHDIFVPLNLVLKVFSIGFIYIWNRMSKVSYRSYSCWTYSSVYSLFTSLSLVLSASALSCFSAVCFVILSELFTSLSQILPNNDAALTTLSSLFLPTVLTVVTVVKVVTVATVVTKNGVTKILSLKFSD